MLSNVKQRLDREDEGFTLIELMVVVLIIAILLAIAIPTFLGARNSANARAAQSNLRNALSAEAQEFTNAQTYSATPATMSTIESGFQWTTVAPTAGNVVSVAVGDSGSGNNLAVELGAYGKDGKCYYVLQSNDPNNSFTGYEVMAQSSNACSVPAVPTTLPASISPGSASANQASSLNGNFYTGW